MITFKEYLAEIAIKGKAAKAAKAVTWEFSNGDLYYQGKKIDEDVVNDLLDEEAMEMRDDMNDRDDIISATGKILKLEDVIYNRCIIKVKLSGFDVHGNILDELEGYIDLAYEDNKVYIITPGFRNDK